ncbi:MAG: hypothetical protein QM733_24855 [Ilumatobacteraceae bacterium]
MKKSAKLHLVLITAAFASCNQQVVPSSTPRLSSVDPNLMAAPPQPPGNQFYQEDPGYSTYPGYGVYSGEDTLYPYNAYPWNLNINIDWSRIFGPRYGFMYPGRPARRGAFWRNRVFVMRGGFGKSAFSSAAS